MRVYIPSHKRPHQQTTWHQLPPSIQEITNIVVYKDEASAYQNYPTVLIPNEPRGIWHKRQWILDNCPDEHMVVIDDDLVFAKRREDDPTRFIPTTEQDMEDLFDGVEDALEQMYIHGAVATREGGNRFTEEFKYNSRALRFHFFNVERLRAIGARFDRTTFMQDFDMTLQILRRGYPNIILNNWVHNQHGSNTHGGCSTTRSAEAHAEAAHKLHKLHPQFVKVVEKTTKGAWGGGVRTDVRVQWKKSFESAPTPDILDRGEV